MPKFQAVLATLAAIAVLPATAFAQSPPLYVTAPVAAPAPVAGTPAPAPATTQKTAEQAAKDKSDEVICHREVEIASLVKTKKTCHTRAQWQYIQAETKRIAQDFILNNQNRPGGN